MANYPLSFDNFTNPTSVDSLSAPSHSLQHADANDAIEALETKLGLSASPAGSATAGHVLVAGTGGTTTWTTVSAGAISTTGGTAGQYLSAGTAGVAQWADVTAPGLTLLATENPSASTGVIFTGLSSGKRYRILANLLASANGNNFGMRFRENSTDKATNYNGAGTSTKYNNGAITSYTLNANTRIWLTNSGDVIPFTASIDVFLHSASRATFNFQLLNSFEGSGVVASGWNTDMTNVNGISIYPEAGTFTGTIKLYEYR